MQSFRIFCIVGLIVVLLTPGWVDAKTIVRSGETVSIANDQTVEGNFYALANTLAVSGTITGDVTAAALTATINTPVPHDVLLLTGRATLNATVTEDVRIVGDEVTIAGHVGGSLLVIGRKLHILSSATITGDLLFIGGEAVIEGKVVGDVLGRGTTWRIDGTVAAVNIHAATLALGSRAEVTGPLQYTSAVELTRSPDAVVSGEITRSDVPAPEEPYRMLAFTFLILSFATLAVFVIARRRVTTLVANIPETMLRDSFIGLAVVLGGFVAGSILLASTLGLLVGVLLLALTVVSIILGIALTPILIGHVMQSLWSTEPSIDLFTLIWGLVLTIIVLLLPIIGIIIVFGVMVTVIGGIVARLVALR